MAKNFNNKQKQMYTFVIPGMCPGLTADQVAGEFERIREAHGELKPEYVVEESRPDGALLHSLFQWNDTVAAEQWRKEQAAKIIRNVHVVVNNTDITCTVRAFVSVTPSKDVPRSYISLKDALSNKDAYEDLLQQAKKDMQSFIRKYSLLKELKSVKAEMLKLL